MHAAARFAAAVLVWVAAGTAAAAETTRYLILDGAGRRIGEQVVTRGDAGRTEVRYGWKDNGRGPDVVEHFRLAPDGAPIEYAASGTQTMGGPIDERFARRGEHAEWRSLLDRGEANVAGTALYLPAAWSIEAHSIAVGLLAARPDTPLPLLPSGALTQTAVDELELARDGRSTRVQLLSLSGVGLEPVFLWATTGAQPRLFAWIYPGWWAAVEEGFEAELPALEARQRAGVGRRLAQLAQSLRHPLPGLTAIRNARVLDLAAGRVGAPSDVFVHRDRITAVVPAGALPDAKPDTEIDAAGRVLLPGLFDMHAHIDRWGSLLHLAAGVTTVRDVGAHNANLAAIRDEQAAGALLAPRIEANGFIEGTSPFSSQVGIRIRTLADAKAAVDWYAARGVRQLKIYNSFPRDALRETIAYAHRRGLKVGGHVPAFLRAAEVVQMGFDEVHHINQVVLTFLAGPKTDTRTLERFYLPAERMAALDLDGRAARDFVALLRRRDTVVDPTLATFEFIRQRDGEVAPAFAAVADHLPPDVQRALRSGGMKIPDDATAARYEASYARMVAFVGRLHRAGITLVAGTDNTPGFTLHSELELYVRAGLSPVQALRTATTNAARVTGTAADRGRIARGQRADLVLVDGDPTRDIGALRKTALVVTQGAWIAPAEVHRALGIRPFVDATPAVRTPAAR